MIYLFDKTQTLTGVIDEHTQALSATFEMKINEASTLDFALPLDDELSNKMAGVKYVGVPRPNNADKIVFLRLMTINDVTDRVEYMAKELAYQELSSSGYIEDKRPTESDAKTLMNIALDGSGYRLGVVNVPGNVKTNFYYTDYLSAVSNVVGLLGGEIYFYVSLTGSKITGRYMDYVVSQGTNTSKTFADGSNLITAERKRDMSSVYTAILPRGKGEQVSDGEGDTPDGYGRRIDISGVEWNKAKGNPLDKKAGDKILVDPEATAEYGNADGTPRLLLKTYDDIEDANVLISKAYADLMAINKPAVQYSATVANVGDMQLGDTIVIMHSKRSMSYRTRVFHITYDLIDNNKTVAEFGNDLSKGSITNQINSISSNGATISDQVQWNISNGGHNNTSYGVQEPANPRKGDVWFKQLPNGNTEQYYFDGTVWVLGAKTDQQWQENQAIAQGTHTTFYGIAVPVGAVKGDVWFKTDNNAPDGKSMYTYDGNSWIKFDGSADASRLQVGTIDASKINVMNLSANDIVTGTLSANFLKGGQIDASQINVINFNANNIVSGTLSSVDITGVKITGSNITSDSTHNNSSIKLSKGYIEIKDKDGSFVGDIGATSDANTGKSNGIAFTQKQDFILALNTTNRSNSSITTSVLRIPSDSHADDPIIEIPARIRGGLRSKDDKMWIQAPSQVIISGNDGRGNQLNVYGDHVDVLGNFTVYNGSKNAAHITRDGVRATPAYETAESYLGDIGEAITDENGEVTIKIDDLFYDIINTDYPYQVFLTNYSNANVWVDKRNGDNFVVKSSEPNAKFAWELKGKRRGYEDERLVDMKLDNKRIEQMYNTGENDGNSD